jgi:uncharacterized protein
MRHGRFRLMHMITKGNGLSSEIIKPSCWVISDGAAGNARQAIALADALGLVPRVIDLQLGHPWDWLAPRLAIAAGYRMQDRNGLPIAAPWPDIAIGCGRRAALLTRCLRDWSAGHSFTVQILDPRIAASRFDVIVTPLHDGLVADNVIPTRGALNPVDDAWLADARREFDALGQFPEPRTAVLIGASNAALDLDDAYFDALSCALRKRHSSQGGSFLVSTSRRTPRERVRALREQLSQLPGVFWGGLEDGKNPYAGFLAWADRIIVSADSVNMISEACATGKPVHAFALQIPSGKLGTFHRALIDSGQLSAIDDGSSVATEPLRESARVAELIRTRWRAFSER